MLVDDKGVFLSQRITPKLALFKTQIVANHLVISHRENSTNTVKIDLNPVQQEIKASLETVVWDDTVEAYEVEKKISKGFYFFNHWTVVFG